MSFIIFKTHECMLLRYLDWQLSMYRLPLLHIPQPSAVGRCYQEKFCASWQYIEWIMLLRWLGFNRILWTSHRHQRPCRTSVRRSAALPQDQAWALDP